MYRLQVVVIITVVYGQYDPSIRSSADNKVDRVVDTTRLTGGIAVKIIDHISGRFMFFLTCLTVI